MPGPNEQSRSSALFNADASGQLAIHLPAIPAAANRPQRKSRWMARFDVVQSASGLFLALFLMAHMFFVSSILISQEAFYRLARFFEGAWLLGKPYPVLVSGVVGLILAVFVLHAWLAMRKFPAGYRQYRAFIQHKNRLGHGDTSLWWLQVLTGFALFFLATAHLFDMLTRPELIGPYESADRVWTGNMWPLYLLLLFAAELHASVGLYRLAMKWGCFAAAHPEVSRRRLRWAKQGFTIFFITLGLLSLSAYMELGRNHAEHAGERYVPAEQSAPPSSGRH